MRAVWSFWTKPWRARRSWNWPTGRHHLLAWVLSVECASRHYPDTALVTDSEGARLLIDGLGLRVRHVSTELDAIAASDPDLWMMGKLQAYHAQREPFVHIDTDVFLWNRLPEKVEHAPVFAQNPEHFRLGASHYKPERMQRLMRVDSQGWIPPEWEWALSLGDQQRGECCGIAGGNHIEFIRYYAKTALQVIEDPRNRVAWSTVANKGEYNTLIEQYHLAACVDYHRNRPDSVYRDIEIRYLFDSFTSAFDENVAARVGFTHLLAGAKQNTPVADRLEKRVARDYPEQYERCLRFAHSSAAW
ncbi:MAG: DUF6734 family protein [Opitutus sp.]